MNPHPHQRARSRLDLAAHRALRRDFIAAFLVLITAALTACSPRSASSTSIAAILLFTGTGTSSNDVAAIATILNGRRLNYSTVNSSQLNAMAESQISRHRLLIVPGGNFVEMGNSLTANTTTNVRNAVKAGLNYLGLCAGGFLAGSFPAPYNSFNLTSGVKFGFYSVESYATHKAAVNVTLADGRTLDQYWEDGPQLTGWGKVVAKYPDGTPAIVEGSVEQGWVVLTGVHPEAPTSWRQGMAFNTSASTDIAYAGTLIAAALNRVTLPHYSE